MFPGSRWRDEVAAIVHRLDALESEIRSIRTELAGLGDAAPRSEVERLDLAFEQMAAINAVVAQKAPISDSHRLDDVYRQLSAMNAEIEAKAPVSESERIDTSFAELSRLSSLTVSERSVEIPWVASSYNGERRVVEVGYAFAESHYLQTLAQLGIEDLVLVDINVDVERARLAGGKPVVADLRNAPFRSSTMDLVLCVSTIEHVGRRDDVYGTDADGGQRGSDMEAITEMARWMAPGGRLLLSVPFGRFEDHGWLINYDADRLDRLVEASGLDLENSVYLELAGGWVRRDREDVAHRGYRSGGAPHAGAVALLELRK